MMHHDVAARGVRIATAGGVAVAAGPAVAATRDGTTGSAASAARHVVFGDHDLTRSSEPLPVRRLGGSTCVGTVVHVARAAQLLMRAAPQAFDRWSVHPYMSISHDWPLKHAHTPRDQHYCNQHTKSSLQQTSQSSSREGLNQELMWLEPLLVGCP